MKRRDFLRGGAAGLASLGLGELAGSWGRWVPDAGALVGDPGEGGDRAAPGPGDADGTVVTILHTNDVHSRIDPFPEDGGRHAGLGGAARRATLIRRIRAENPRTLLLDAGDVFQGTPYFNLFRGEVDFKVMTALGYDAMTIGNHDFDAGIDGLVEALAHARHELVSANYDVAGTPLAGRVRPWIVRDLGPARVGIFGLGVKLAGLVSESQCRGVVYGPPAEAARRAARLLREQERCDLVVCLSHLGHEGYAGEIGDQEIAAEVEGIDLIVGGHSHTFLDRPVRVSRRERDTLIFQVGWGGIHLGRVDFHLRAGRVARAQAAALPVGDRLTAHVA